MYVPQVKLLSGTHPDTGKTGQGCFMNVIAYLNAEPVITDKSECVCFVIRQLAIWANDWMTDAERPQLLPFLLRALGSRTDDKAEVTRRLALVVGFAKDMAKFAEHDALVAHYAMCADKNAHAAEYAAEYAAKCAAASAAEYAAYAADAYVTYAAESAKYAARKQIIKSILALFDSALPPLQDTDERTVERVRQLESLAL